MPEFSKRSVKELSKVLKVFGNAVGDTSFEIGPNKFIGIKFRRISGEVKGFDSRSASKELFDEFGPMKRASVPEKDDPASEVSCKVTEKMSDLFGPNVFVEMETRVESKTFSFRRDGDGREGRDFSPPPCDLKPRSSALERPGSLEVGDKRESAFIQEYQVGSKLIGLFLYEAKRDASSNEFRLPVFPWLFEWAPDNSSPDCPSDTKDLRSSSAPEISCVRSGRCVLKSKRPSNSRLPRALSPRRVSRFSSVALREAEAVPYEALTSSLPVPSSGRRAANAPRSLEKLLLLGLRSGKYGLVSKAGPPDVVFFRVFRGCHEVS